MASSKEETISFDTKGLLPQDDSTQIDVTKCNDKQKNPILSSSLHNTDGQLSSESAPPMESSLESKRTTTITMGSYGASVDAKGRVQLSGEPISKFDSNKVFFSFIIKIFILIVFPYF